MEKGVGNMILIFSTNKELLHHYEFSKPIEELVKKENQAFATKKYDKLISKDLEKATKIIICGTSLKDLEYAKHLEKFNWIKKFDKPIFGICAGAQIIARIFGTTLKDSTKIGLEKVIFKKEFLNIKKELQVYHLHQKKISSLKNPLENYSKDNEAFKHKTKQIYATLFHPEVRNSQIISNFIKNG